ncbi:MAG: HAMP domain-containing sensor histidine kinase, partial [Candidatus Lokiarchaeota archaeon]
MDITEIKEAEEKLKELQDMKNQFIRRASHELKTPLITINGYSDLILKSFKDKTTNEIRNYLNEIKNGSKRLEIIIENLLKINELEENEDNSVNIEVNLTNLIHKVINKLNPLIKMREHKISLKLHKNVKIKINPNSIFDVISNLLLNAIKYTPPQGSIELKTTISNDSNVVISIKDNGIGFTKIQKKKLFQKFGKIERFGQGFDIMIGGTGLGLYISKKIIESHRGTIWMESEGKNKGSTFYVKLPLEK